jgi:hypothetical protein
MVAEYGDFLAIVLAERCDHLAMAVGKLRQRIIAGLDCFQRRQRGSKSANESCGSFEVWLAEASTRITRMQAIAGFAEGRERRAKPGAAGPRTRPAK